MGRFDQFRKLADRMRGKHTLIIQDGAPLHYDTYYDRLLSGLPSVDGMRPRIRPTQPGRPVRCCTRMENWG